MPYDELLECSQAGPCGSTLEVPRGLRAGPPPWRVGPRLGDGKLPARAPCRIQALLPRVTETGTRCSDKAGAESCLGKGAAQVPRAPRGPRSPAASGVPVRSRPLRLPGTSSTEAVEWTHWAGPPRSSPCSSHPPPPPEWGAPAASARTPAGQSAQDNSQPPWGTRSNPRVTCVSPRGSGSPQAAASEATDPGAEDHGDRLSLGSGGRGAWARLGSPRGSRGQSCLPLPGFGGPGGPSSSVASAAGRSLPVSSQVSSWSVSPQSPRRHGS